ncbi:MAG: hypothetical protein JNK29_13840 [Anaerolineales bacterium]|nr:hypothetical protein [Anaerolineales bacterium]
MRKVLLILMLALAACQPLKLDFEPYSIVPERRGQSAPAADQHEGA